MRYLNLLINYKWRVMRQKGTLSGNPFNRLATVLQGEPSDETESPCDLQE